MGYKFDTQWAPSGRESGSSTLEQAAQLGNQTNDPLARCLSYQMSTWLICLCCFPGRQRQQQHVQPAASLPVSRLSPGLGWYPRPSSTHQNQCAGPHRCRRTHVHQQPGHPHQVPRITVRGSQECHELIQNDPEYNYIQFNFLPFTWQPILSFSFFK